MATKLPVVVIVGRPNVGKSTFFNRLIKRRAAVVEDQIEQVRVQAEVAMEEADTILFLTEVTAGVTPDDWELANRLRGSKKPILVVVNKTDNPQRAANAGEFYALGLGEIFMVSSLHGKGVADLLDRIVEELPQVEKDEEEPDEIRLAILGRPNVGKSSLLNAFTGEQRAIVSNIPGTTRDAIDTLLSYRDERFRLIDTAGLRRRGKIQGSIEYYMVDRAMKALDRANVGLIVVDGDAGLTDGDKRTAKLAHDGGKAVVIAVNKWDVKEPPNGKPKQKSPEKKAFLQQIRDELPEVSYAPVCFTSAKESAGLEPVLDTVLKALDSYNFRIATGPFNRLIQDALFSKPYSTKGKFLKVYYATQVATRPPTFALFCNDPEIVHFSYLRYIENQFRKKYPLEGTPLRWKLKSSHEKKS
ncbi:MAG: ribosome biogenesis GTPase Der [Armatimonadetes bacterium]|nr:ribosome biogenesis GTPase Der [Armatimonadota bacterium]